MKKILMLPAIIIALTSCENEEIFQDNNEDKSDIIESPSIALAKNYGPIAADGCGWVLEMDSIDFSTYELLDELKQDSLYILSTFQQTTDSFTCFGGHTFPNAEVQNIPESITRMYYSETQCTDPWGARQATDLEDVKKISEYLSSISIGIVTMKIFESKSQEAFCLACSCGTGRSFVVGVEDQYVDLLSNIGFQEMECYYNDPLNEIDWLEELQDNLDITTEVDRITQYEYNEDCVFLVEPCFQCPDALSALYDIEKNVICEFGGITGKNTCPDFYSTAINEIELYYE